MELNEVNPPPPASLQTQRSLKEVFDSTFHQKFQFNDFLRLEVDRECSSFSIKGKEIVEPSEKLKAYLRFINNVILVYAKINKNVVHSYRKGKSPYTAVEKHAQSKYFFQTDIGDFFYSITDQYIAQAMEENLSDVPISDITQHKNRLLDMVTIKKRLPVGFATSPSISNTCLYTFDNALESYCLSNKLIYTRYSDDIIISSMDKAALSKMHDVVTETLKTFVDDEIQLNPSKTRHTHKGNKVKLLGIVVLPSGQLSVDIKLKKQLETLLYFYINDKNKFEDFLHKKYKGDISRPSGQMSYINAIVPSYLDKLRKKYGNYIVDAFFHKTIR